MRLEARGGGKKQNLTVITHFSAMHNHPEMCLQAGEQLSPPTCVRELGETEANLPTGCVGELGKTEANLPEGPLTARLQR